MPRRLGGGMQRLLEPWERLGACLLQPESPMRRLGGVVPRDFAGLVIATHEMGFAREVADRVLFFDQGQIVEQGPPEQVLGAPREERTRRFLAQAL